jgi:predicted PurR-regulated permease PerM
VSVIAGFTLQRFLWGVGTLAAVFVATRIPHTISIFLLAALIAFGAAPLTYHLERRMPRTLAISLVYLLLLLGITVVILLVVPAAISQAQTILALMPAQLDRLHVLVDQASAHLQGRFGRPFGIGLQRGRDLINLQINAHIETATATAFSWLGNWLVNAATSFFIFVSALVLSAFFLSRSEAMADGFRMLFPANRRHLADEFENEVARVFGGFVAGQFGLCVLAGTLVWAVLTMMHVPFAVLIGVVTAVGYAVPFFGMAVVQIFAALLAIPMGFSTVLWVTAIIFFIARVIDTIVAPKVMSESVGVSPIVVMFAVFAGGELFGLSGLVLGIPAAALMKSLWKIYSRARADSQLSISQENRVLSALEAEIERGTTPV